MKSPLVSVLLPVYNCEQYIKECITSILNQTLTDFELLIFNDGSTDASLEIIKEFKDNRILIFDSSLNVGYVRLLNEGILKSKGNYIVRMDADDICYPNRFYELVKFMDHNPEIGVCGSYVRVFGNVKEYIWKLPTHDNSIKALLPFRIPFVHPSVIMRKKTLTDNNIHYKNDFLPAEDYEMWCNLSRVTKFANIPLVLLKYRQHNAQISKEKKDLQQNNSNRVRELYFKQFFLTQEDFDFYQNSVNEKIECSISFLEKSVVLFAKINAINVKSNLYDIKSFSNELSYQLFKIATHISSHGIYTLKIYRASGFSKSSYITNTLYFKYILKNCKLIGK